MLTTTYLLQDATDLFDPIAGLHNMGVIKSFHTGLVRTRGHLLNIKKEACCGSHEEVCYHFHMGASLLMAVFDGMAVYVEKKVSSEPSSGVVYWREDFHRSTLSDATRHQAADVRLHHQGRHHRKLAEELQQALPAMVAALRCY